MGVQDPRLRLLVERFKDVRLIGAENRVFEFFDAGDDVAHLFAASVLEFEIHSQSVFKGTPFQITVHLPDGKVLFGPTFEIYLSRNGVRLLELANDREPGAGIEAVIFLEVNRGDVISKTVFEIAPRDGMTASQFLSETVHFSPLFSSALRLTRREYEELVEKRFNGEGVFDTVEDMLLEAAGELLIALQGPVQNLAHALADKKMPHELWHPTDRPKDFNEFLNELAQTFDGAIDAVLDALASVPRLSVSQLLEELPGESLLPDAIVDHISAFRRLVSDVERMWNGFLQFFTDAAQFIKLNKPSAGDSFDTLIGYFCGIWDAIIDSVSGLIELAGLALSLLGAFIKASKDPRVAIELVLEALDQLIAAFKMIDWGAIWSHFAVAILPKVVDILRREADDLADDIARNSAAVGYYFGYLVYNIAETFFPPLKLSKAAAGTKAATNAARYADRIFSR